MGVLGSSLHSQKLMWMKLGLEEQRHSLKQRLQKYLRAVNLKKRYEKSRRKERGKKRRRETDNRLSGREPRSLVVALNTLVCVFVLSLHVWEENILLVLTETSFLVDGILNY